MSENKQRASLVEKATWSLDIAAWQKNIEAEANLITFITALDRTRVPIPGGLDTRLAHLQHLLDEAPEESSTIWCTKLFHSLVNTLIGTLEFGRRGYALDAILEEVSFATWCEPGACYNYQLELKYTREEVENIVNTLAANNSSINSIRQLPIRAQRVAYRLYAMEQGFIIDMDTVTA